MSNATSGNDDLNPSLATFWGDRLGDAAKRTLLGRGVFADCEVRLKGSSAAKFHRIVERSPLCIVEWAEASVNLLYQLDRLF